MWFLLDLDCLHRSWTCTELKGHWRLFLFQFPHFYIFFVYVGYIKLTTLGFSVHVKLFYRIVSICRVISCFFLYKWFILRNCQSLLIACQFQTLRLSGHTRKSPQLCPGSLWCTVPGTSPGRPRTPISPYSLHQSWGFGIKPCYAYQADLVMLKKHNSRRPILHLQF